MRNITIPTVYLPGIFTVALDGNGFLYWRLYMSKRFTFGSSTVGFGFTLNSY